MAELGTRLGPDSHMGKPETAVIISTCRGPDTALKHFAWTNQLSEGGTLIFPIYKLGKKGTEKLSGLTSVTQVLKSRAWSWTGSEAPVLKLCPMLTAETQGIMAEAERRMTGLGSLVIRERDPGEDFPGEAG